MSLRGAQRRGNLNPRRRPNPRLLHCVRSDTPHAVERSPLLSMSLRGAQRRGNLHPRRHPNPRLLHCLRNDTPYAVERSPCSLCHCEERSDAAISTRGGAPTQDCFTAFAMTHPMPWRAAPCSRCHCEERSDAAISTRGGTPTRDCFTAFAMTEGLRSQWQRALSASLTALKMVFQCDPTPLTVAVQPCFQQCHRTQGVVDAYR